jgi:hypothetical protein
VGSLKQEDYGPGRPGEHAMPYFQNNWRKIIGGVWQAVDILPRKSCVLSSKPSTIKKIKEHCVLCNFAFVLLVQKIKDKAKMDLKLIRA